MPVTDIDGTGIRVHCLPPSVRAFETFWACVSAITLSNSARFAGSGLWPSGNLYASLKRTYDLY